ncbi:MAG TPA: hypothetical protein VF173_12730 [Thermoanaerobaculia bacterium]|nr:hypothetical protein [Thermoanaerobaculia bacterium]
MNESKRASRLSFVLCFPLAVGCLGAVHPARGAEGDASTSAPSLEIPVKPDLPAGYPGRVGLFETPLRQDLTSLQLTGLGQGRYALRFSSGTETPALPEIDLRPFIPRIPLLAKGDPSLTRIALIQRELNRNQTRYPAPGRPETVFVANNCLRGGLWEIGLDHKGAQGASTYYHGWFTFPKTEYARLFETLNGVSYSTVAADLDQYPKLDGLAVPLAKIRSVVRDVPVPAIDSHLGEPVDQFSEQARKAKLVISPAVRTYGDWSAPDRQPIVTAKFSEPGFYDSKDPMRFDLAWLAHPAEAHWRWVQSPVFPDGFAEIELRYQNGYRLLLADARLANLPARGTKPADEADLLHVTFGIETPEIYANADERDRELAAERPAYLFLLDAKGNLVDNHHAGLDRVYLWREAGAPDRLHLYLVSYERIALVSHLSMAVPAEPPKPAAQ